MTKRRVKVLLTRIAELEQEAETTSDEDLVNDWARDDEICGELMQLYSQLRKERENPPTRVPNKKKTKMTQPRNQNKTPRLSRNSFHFIVKWMEDHLAEITPGKTARELTEMLNTTEAIAEFIPEGGLGVHTVPGFIRATGYVGAVVGQKGKMAKTKIGVGKFNDLKREVAKLKESIRGIKETIQRLITIIQDHRETREKIDKLTPLEDVLDDPRLTEISPEDEPRSTDGDPAMREHTEVDKVSPQYEYNDDPYSHPMDLKIRDDNDAQLDDTYPEDAPHQEEYKKAQEQKHKDTQGQEMPPPDITDMQMEQQDQEQGHRDAETDFLGFLPSPQIRKMMDSCNESMKDQQAHEEEEETTSFPD